MIHIATIHWNTDKWISLQLKYLNTYILEDFRIYSFLNGIDTKRYEHHFAFVSEEPVIEHEKKLNILKDVILFSSKNEDDILIFIDGDAFPVAPLMQYAYKKLKEHPLLAIQRKENYLGENLPHPSFCLSTVGFWKAIDGNWNRKFIGKYLGEKHFEVGGELGEKLKNNKIEWYPMLRTHSLSDHPLWYGIYDNIIYHHGAGFRNPVARIDKYNLQLAHKTYFFMTKKLPILRKKLNPYKSIYNKELNESKNMFQRIKNDPSFFFKFLNSNDK